MSYSQYYGGQGHIVAGHRVPYESMFWPVLESLYKIHVLWASLPMIVTVAQLLEWVLPDGSEESATCYTCPRQTC